MWYEVSHHLLYPFFRSNNVVTHIDKLPRRLRQLKAHHNRLVHQVTVDTSCLLFYLTCEIICRLTSCTGMSDLHDLTYLNVSYNMLESLRGWTLYHCIHRLWICFWLLYVIRAESLAKFARTACRKQSDLILGRCTANEITFEIEFVAQSTQGYGFVSIHTVSFWREDALSYFLFF